jgi:hypothetical protein
MINQFSIKTTEMASITIPNQKKLNKNDQSNFLTCKGGIYTPYLGVQAGDNMCC